MSNAMITVCGIAFVFVMTALGAATVFLLKKQISPAFSACIMGFSSGIMVAASVWSMLIPAITQGKGVLSVIAPVFGVILGGVFLQLLGALLPKNERSATLKFFLAVTLHNIPEGLAVGFAFGAATTVGASASFLSALGLAFGIGLQNFPEGAAVSLPVLQTGKGRFFSFSWGVASGVVEPIFATAGYFLAAMLCGVQPWLLGFAAGAMLYVVAEYLIPEATKEKTAFGVWGFLLGFLMMMTLDVALG